MRQFTCFFGVAVVIATGTSVPAFGHGTPVHVDVSNNRLVVSQGVPGGTGFAANMYVENDEDGDFWTMTSSPPLVVWNIPGFEILGMDDSSNLSLEVIRRPVKDSSPPEQRNLWYWNNLTEKVEPAPSGLNFYLLATTDDRKLAATDTMAPAPVLLSDPMTGQLGFHNHGLLAYALDNATPPPAGAYGFFARMTSTWYQPSDPFLVVINNNADYDKMFTAALAINAAAVDAATLPGDYDGNGQVQPNDYQYWRERFGNLITAGTSPDGSGNGVVDAADYILWRNAFAPSAAGSILVAVPESTTLAWCVLLLAFRALGGRRVALPR
jgi:hypothetical protein